MSSTIELEPPMSGNIMLKSYQFTDCEREINDDKRRQEKLFTVYWRDVNYTVYRGLIDRAISAMMGHDAPSSRMVLRGVSGCFKAGEMTALMGPSGAGKTTLLECLIGKRQTGLSGLIACRDHEKIKLAIIPQHERFFTILTVRETMMYASLLQNATLDMEERGRGVEVPVRTPFKDLLTAGQYPFWAHVAILCSRIVKMTFRDPWLFWTQVASYIFMAVLLWGIFGDVGGPGGCPPRLDSSNFDPVAIEKLPQTIRDERIVSTINMGAIFFSVIILTILNLMPTIFSGPSEAQVVMKEKNNQWYSGSCYFVARTLTDFPISASLSIFFCSMQYFMNGQTTDEAWRFFAYTGQVVLLGLIAQSYGIIIAFILAESPMAALFLGPISTIPMCIVCGFFITLPELSKLFVAGSYTTFLRFPFEGCVVALYGRDRCGEDVETYMRAAQETLTSWLTMIFEAASAAAGARVSGPQVQLAVTSFASSVVSTMLSSFVGDDGHTRSNVMNRFSLRDKDMETGTAVTITLLVMSRIFAYIVVMRKLHQKM
ncbi:ATP-binding cassette sub-family G member 1 [Halotydeus destructor]|nr:ATP-binding cassette sub-family G member 1 [Halotydeus destructor]